MHVQIQENGAIFTDLHFEEEVVYIGARAGCGIRLEHDAVANQHAVLTPRIGPTGDPVWTIAPMDPEAPITLNGVRLTSSAPVQADDRIGIAHFELIINANGHTETDTIARETHRRESRKALPASTLIKNTDDGVEFTHRRFIRLSRFNFHLAQCTDLRSLLDVTLTCLHQAFVSVRLAWIGVRRQPEGPLEFVEARLPRGTVGNDPELLSVLEKECMQRDQMICVSRMEGPGSPSFLCAPLIGPRGPLGMIYVESEPRAVPYRERHLNLITGIAAQITQQLVAIIEQQLRTKAAAAVGEVSLANLVQERLDPKSLPQWTGLQVAAYCKPGQETCSDVYDLLKLTNGAAAFLVAKATVESKTDALLLMTETRATFRIACLHNDTPHTILKELNWLLYDAREQRQLDVLVVVIEPASGGMRYASAGGCFGVLISENGEPRPLARNTTPPVAVAANTRFVTVSETMGPAETLALFTKGITATVNPQGKPLDPNQLVDSLCDGFGQPAGNSLDDLVTDLADYLKEGKQPEDITLLLLHRESPPTG